MSAMIIDIGIHASNLTFHLAFATGLDGCREFVDMAQQLCPGAVLLHQVVCDKTYDN
jgi:hypothetical protein